MKTLILKSLLMLSLFFAQVVFGVENIKTAASRPYALMLEEGVIRMAVPYERVVYVDARGKNLGGADDIAETLGEFLSNKYKKKIRVQVVPVVTGKLIDSLRSGQADFGLVFNNEYDVQIRSANYLKYSHPHLEKDVLVSRKDARPVSSLKELSGETVCVGRLKESDIFNKVNQSLTKDGKAAIQLYRDRHILDDVDFLQMLDAGLIQYAFVSDWKAKLWSSVFTNIKINEETSTPGGSPGDVIVKPEHKQLAEDILIYASSPYIEKALTHYRQKDFLVRKHALKNPTKPLEWSRFLSMRNYFKQYGEDYHLDPLFLAGLGFQESMLNQSAMSPSGAIGVMQLLPSTGNSLKVGDIRQLEPNIHAGAKYINSLLYGMSLEGDISQEERSFFAVAAYNAGPNHISKARELAMKMGFDPNKWFLNVEMTTAKLFGEQTFLYVRNVYKYFVTYDLKQRNEGIGSATFTQILRK